MDKKYDPTRDENKGIARGPQARMSVVKPKNLKGTLMRLWDYILPERVGMLIVFGMAASSALTAMITPLLIGRAIDTIKAGDLPTKIILILLSVYIGNTFIWILQGRINAAVSQRIVLNLRKTLFGKFQRLPLGFFDTRPHGELMSRLANDVDNISMTISESLTQLMLLIATVVGVFFIMLFQNIWLTLAAVIISPIAVIFTGQVTKRSRVLFKQQQATLGRLNSTIEETISGLTVVKSFCMEERIKEDFGKVNEDMCSIGTKALIISGLLMPLMNVLNNLSFVSVTFAGGLIAAQGLISTGTISTFLLYSRQFTRPLNDIANIYNTLQTAVAGAERVFEIIDEQEEPQDSDTDNKEMLTDPKGEVIFSNVNFGYRADVPVLRDVSFAIKPGSKLAIVGSTGAGKTTIISLLARFYDVTAGSIQIEGKDIRDYKKSSLRHALSVVLQDPALFNTTVRENIRYGRMDATDEEVVNAAQIADADDFIRRLPNGYDTIVGDGAGSLSQGERQLLTIARAVLVNRPILILDEATSSVDTMTEKKIRKAMQALMEDRTSIAIAHRLSTIRDSDLILVIENGQLAEQGTHDELLALGGVYSRMYVAQTT